MDLTITAVVDLVGLGFSDRTVAGNGIDASDQGGVIAIQNWPVLGMYQPDAIAAAQINGTTYLYTANEGDTREWSAIDEQARVNGVALDNTVFPNEPTLKVNTNLGRLRITNRTGDIDQDGDFDALYAFGGRSFSVRDENSALILDSGDDLEQITAAAFPTQFNSNHDANNSFKRRSDDKGPEPEGITIAEIEGTPYAFVCLERIGGVVVYDLTNPTSPVLVEYVNHRDFSGNLAGGTALDLGPESSFVIRPQDSPNGLWLLVVPNEVSGNVSLFEIETPSTAAPEIAWETDGGLFSIEPNPAVGGTSIRLQTARPSESDRGRLRRDRCARPGILDGRAPRGNALGALERARARRRARRGGRVLLPLGDGRRGARAEDHAAVEGP